jgi:hypothetical protein
VKVENDASTKQSLSSTSTAHEICHLSMSSTISSHDSALIFKAKGLQNIGKKGEMDTRELVNWDEEPEEHEGRPW